MPGDRQLLVVLGAGASYDCASLHVRPHEEMRPPLVKELFDQRFADVLNEYPLAEQISPDIRIAVSSGAVGLEAYLRHELHESEFAHLRRRYQAIPLYLQHLLWQVGRRYARHPDNYDRLITEALRFERVTFVTLNYDTILDRRLALDRPMRSMDDYGSHSSHWSLVKLHGSINWGRPIVGSEWTESMHLAHLANDPTTYASEFANFGEDIELEDDVVFCDGDGLENFRRVEIEIEHPRPQYGISIPRIGEKDFQLLYPALSVPLGAEDEIVCPESHVNCVTEHMSYAFDGLNILVIGYSGLDQEVLSLLASSGRPVRAIKVINGDYDLSMAAAQIFGGRLGFTVSEEMVFPGGFTDFAQSNAMAEFLRAL
jgi:hypothetical protein